MKLSKIIPLVGFAALALLPFSLAAQDAAPQASPGKKKLAVTKIVPTPSLKTRMESQGTILSLTSVIESLSPQVYDRLTNTKRFTLLERADADALIEENAAGGSAFAFNQADYVLTINVDNFNDRTETRELRTLGKTVSTRAVDLVAVAKITEVATQKALATTSFKVTRRDAEQKSGNTTEKVGNANDLLLTDATTEMAQKIADRVIDVVFPARILFKRGTTVTINRNDSSYIRVGQIWEAFTLGEKSVDPDTGEEIREEISSGKIRITHVSPQNSRGEILDDAGIEPQAIVRMVEEAPSAE